MIVDFGTLQKQVRTFSPFNINIRYITDLSNPISAYCIYPHFYYELFWNGKMRAESISEEAKQIQYFDWAS